MTITKILTVLLAIALIGCGPPVNDKDKDNKIEAPSNNKSAYMAEKIKIEELKNALTKLQEGQTEFPFIGITSNGTDCIYFMPKSGKFDVDFEAMGADQLPYIDKLKVFADANKFKSLMTTYNNQPQYKSDKPAPVLHIQTNLSLEDVAKLGERIQSEIFKNSKDTVYEIVP